MFLFVQFRFRGMISTQPGSTPLASFKIVSLEEDIPRYVDHLFVKYVFCGLKKVKFSTPLITNEMFSTEA